MFIRLKQDHNEWIFNASKGALLDVPEEYGQDLIERGIAVAEDTERAINTLAGVEQREEPTKSRKK